MIVTIAALAALIGGTGAAPVVRAVPELNLERYLGRWYEIARFPNSFQGDCSGDVTATYPRRPDGRLSVLNRCRKSNGEWKEAEGVAKLADQSGPASKLKVRFAPAFLSFLPFVWGDYWVLALDEDYQWAAVGTPDRKYLWILSRTPALDPAVKDRIFAELEAMGFRTGDLVATSQSR